MDEITIASLSPSLSPSEQSCVRTAIDELGHDPTVFKNIHAFAATIAQQARSNINDQGLLEQLLTRFPLTGDEGLSLMRLAEALLRIPDSKTAHNFITDHLRDNAWNMSDSNNKTAFLKLSSLGLVAGNVALKTPLSGAALPVLHGSIKSIIGKIGHQFVLGETIDKALNIAAKKSNDHTRTSFDMLGEGARTQADADRYFLHYKNALIRIAQYSKTIQTELELNPNKSNGISVKLSALHPRYTALQSAVCIPHVTEKLRELCSIAADHNIALTIDAEESDRLCLSLAVIENILQDPSLSHWQGFGFAVQAYQKRAANIIEWAAERTHHYSRHIQIRLVKGAYWDQEIKKAQEQGLSDFPVFTRKCHTDINYLACVKIMLRHSDVIFPMFATHNAHTIAAILHMTNDVHAHFEFQKLHGMGDSVYTALRTLLCKDKDIQICTYAPVGAHTDLLPYLVRRMLENGANSSFINKLLDDNFSINDLLRDPIDKALSYDLTPHPDILPPSDLFDQEPPAPRKNSYGIDLSDSFITDRLYRDIDPFLRDTHHCYAQAIINGLPVKSAHKYTACSPNKTSDQLGTVYLSNERDLRSAMTTAQRLFPAWSSTPVAQRAAYLSTYADALEDHMPQLIALLIREAGKTMADCIAEIRESVDFCRYYANQIMTLSPDGGVNLPGPTGETNQYYRHGRGVFVCISPWNFPLAIFTGQIAAAIVSGNCVIAKPAEQTPLIASFAVDLWHRIGLPAGVINLLIGDGFVGESLINQPDIAGVCFTGSVPVARAINQSLAHKDAEIIPLIAETGGMNAMIIDSTALLEQVIDDTLISAFGSAGQRCSAQRIALIQDDILPDYLNMLSGAILELKIGPSHQLSSDVGPIIDDEALAQLKQYSDALANTAQLIAKAPSDSALTGHFFAPRAFLLHDLHSMEREIFGPILHVIPYKAKELIETIETLNAKNYALTLGIHSRSPSFIKTVCDNAHAGNVYINRSMIGAIVGSQPFGGHSLSGTGPKAGGPDYLRRFMHERTITTNTTAAGGNVSLVSLQD